VPFVVPGKVSEYVDFGFMLCFYHGIC